MLDHHSVFFAELQSIFGSRDLNKLVEHLTVGLLACPRIHLKELDEEVVVRDISVSDELLRAELRFAVDCLDPLLVIQKQLDNYVEEGLSKLLNELWRHPLRIPFLSPRLVKLAYKLFIKLGR
jgi:hypothetical protein